MTAMQKTTKICLITHQGIARHLQSLIHKEDGVYGAELHKVRTSGSIGTATFSELEEQGKLVILCTAERAEKIYALAYDKLELGTKENGMLYMQTIASTMSPKAPTSSQQTSAE